MQKGPDRKRDSAIRFRSGPISAKKNAASFKAAPASYIFQRGHHTIGKV